MLLQRDDVVNVQEGFGDCCCVCEKIQLLAHVLTLCGAHTLTGRDVLTGKSTLNDKDVSQLDFDRRELQITSVGREWQIMDSMSFSHSQRYSGNVCLTFVPFPSIYF